jgi:hypothetical protein
MPEPPLFEREHTENPIPIRHAGMAAKVLRALAAVLVGGAAKGVNLKEHRSQQGEELLTNGLQMRKLRHVNPSQMDKRTDGEDSTLIDFCSFASGRVTDRPPYT